MLEEENSDDYDVVDMLEEDELDYLKKIYKIPKTGESRPCLNRKRSACLEEETYEKLPRYNVQIQKEKRWLLPIKGKDGFILREAEIEEEPVLSQNDSLSEEQMTEKPESLAESFAYRLKQKHETKAKIGMYSSLIVENPENNMDRLKELTILLKEKDSTANLVITRLTMLSLLEIYRDILPSYRIRTLGDSEKSQKMKKETRKLNQFEERLLRNYKQYLEFLEKTVRSAFKSNVTEINLYTERKKKLGLVAVRCLSELLITRANFNYGANIVEALVPLAASSDNNVSEICCDAIRCVFREDKRGETSLAIVVRIVKLTKSKPDLRPEVLRTFLNLNPEVGVDDKAARDAKKMRERLAKMSRRERKREKKVNELEKQLRETEAEENRSERTRIGSEILKRIFLIYFRIIKNSIGSRLLTPVLEGLSKFAHLINVEFFDDLLNELYTLPDRVNLTEGEILHCLHAVFVVLSGRGSALNVDPQRFFGRLYRTLLRIHVGNRDDDLDVLWKCLDVTILKKNKIHPLCRTLAFVKRLCTISLQTSGHGTSATLSAVRYLMTSVRGTDILLETEEAGGSGVFLPESEDPEHCNAQETALWELLYPLRHYHPTARLYALHLISGCPERGTGRLAPDLIKLKPVQLYSQYQNPDWEKRKSSDNRKNVMRLNSEFLKQCWSIADSVNKNS